MRLFAEEKKNGTDELLKTSPLTVGQIILGKYLAALVMLAVMLGLTALLVVFAFAFGNPELAPVADRLPRACSYGGGLPGHRALLLLADREPDRRRHPDLRDLLLFLVHQLGLRLGRRGFWQGRPQLHLVLPALREPDQGHPGHEGRRLLT